MTCTPLSLALIKKKSPWLESMLFSPLRSSACPFNDAEKTSLCQLDSRKKSPPLGSDRFVDISRLFAVVKALETARNELRRAMNQKVGDFHRNVSKDHPRDNIKNPVNLQIHG